MRLKDIKHLNSMIILSEDIGWRYYTYKHQTIYYYTINKNMEGIVITI